eukprot:TRINITY_DN6109_c0_g1_i1.p1 TRINITY_DN6109_c0_g1~~TRINITY_DN6109_c0_g1_i1.p1  ORF type:complete len:294 (-),score=70.78 TRINITY_DN6109_c0_g1_i1:94-975(-)
MSDIYARHLLKIVVAQICQTLDLQGIENGAAETLVDVVQKFIEQIGLLSHSYAEHSCRSECNINDVIKAIEEMTGDNALRELALYYSGREDLVFPKVVPPFPVSKDIHERPRTEIMGPTGNNKPEHIPAYFPNYPSNYTYIDTPTYSSHEIDLKKTKQKKVHLLKKEEQNLLNLHNSLDNTETTYYDEPMDIDESQDLKKVKPVEAAPRLPSGPIDKTSPLFSTLYRSRGEGNESSNYKPPETTEALIRREKVMKILSLDQTDSDVHSWGEFEKQKIDMDKIDALRRKKPDDE